MSTCFLCESVSRVKRNTYSRSTGIHPGFVAQDRASLEFCRKSLALIGQVWTVSVEAEVNYSFDSGRCRPTTRPSLAGNRDETLERLSENKQVRISVLPIFLSLRIGGIQGATGKRASRRLQSLVGLSSHFASLGKGWTSRFDWPLIYFSTETWCWTFASWLEAISKTVSHSCEKERTRLVHDGWYTPARISGFEWSFSLCFILYRVRTSTATKLKCCSFWFSEQLTSGTPVAWRAWSRGWLETCSLGIRGGQACGNGEFFPFLFGRVEKLVAQNLGVANISSRRFTWFSSRFAVRGW